MCFNREYIHKKFLLVLKLDDKTKKMYIDYEPIIEFSVDLKNKLSLLLKDDSVEFETLEKFLKNNNFEIIRGYYSKGPFSYAILLNGAYENLNIDITDILNEVKNKKEELENRKVTKELYEKEKNDFIKYILNKIKNGIIAYELKVTYQNIINDRRIIAYSHRKIGWSLLTYSVTQDFSFQVRTNFAYGSVSNFYTNLIYKQMPIIRFTDWVYYRYAKLEEIINYTIKHKLSDESWYDAFGFVAQAYNTYLEDERKFIKIYIVDEIEKLVNELKKIYDYRNGYVKMIDDYHFFRPERNFIDIKLEGFSLIEFKGEKLSGALGLISKIFQFKDIYEVKNAIDEIEMLNENIFPILLDELPKLNEQINFLQTKLFEKKLEMEKLDELRNKYKLIKEKLNFVEGANINYEELENKYNEALKEYNSILSEKNKFEIFKEKINSYINKIRTYFYNKGIIL